VKQLSVKAKNPAEIVLSLDEKLERALDFESKTNRISNFTKNKYFDADNNLATIVIEFWFEKKERKIIEYAGNKPVDPRVSPSINTINLFKDKNYWPNIEEIYNELVKMLKQYIYHSNPVVFLLVAAGAIASYYPEIFSTYPYFDFYGSEASCGKSTFLKCLTFASYQGHFVVSPTLATTFRIIHNYNCMMGIDELGKLLNTKEGRAYYGILLAGHQKSGVVPRCSEKDFDDIKFFRVFGLKAWSRLEYMKPELLSRAITITMVRNAGRKKLDDNPTNETFEHIRDDLYILRLIDNFFIEQTYKELAKDSVLYDRTKDLFLPLLTIAKLADREAYYEILEYAKTHQKKAKSLSLDNWLVLLMETIKENQLFGEQKVTEIRNHFREVLVQAGEINDDDKSRNKITSQKIKYRLDRLGFCRSEKRTDGNIHYDIKKKIFDEQAYIYLKDYSAQSQELDNLTNLEQNLINSSITPSELPHKPNKTHLTHSKTNEVNESNEVTLGVGSIEKVMQILTFLELEQGAEPVFTGDIIEAGLKQDLDQQTIESILEQFKKDGIIFSTKQNYVKLGT